MPELHKVPRRGADPDNGFGYELKDSGEEELIKNWLFETRAKEKFVFFDVGANRGDWTGFLLSCNRPNVEGHLFEISPVMQERLWAAHGHREDLTFNNFGLSDHNGKVPFRRYIGAEGVNTILVDAMLWDKMTPSVVEECLVMTGDEYCEGRGIDHIDLLKIDTEGNEWPVIQGFDRMISDQKIDVIQFEYGYITMELRIYIRDFWRYFDARGYKVGRLRKEGIDWTDYQLVDNDYDSCPNWVAFSHAACID
jgi:FkbM family methyltransferase